MEWTHIQDEPDLREVQEKVDGMCAGGKPIINDESWIRNTENRKEL